MLKRVSGCLQLKQRLLHTLHELKPGPLTRHLVLGGQLYTDENHMATMTLQSLCLMNASFCLACQLICSSYFFPPKLLESDERMNLLAVMLYDFQDRKFNPRELQGQQEVIHEVRDMEEFLLRYRGE